MRCGAVRCGAVRCGRLVQGGHGAGAARVRFFFMRLRAAAIGAVVITVGMLGFSLGMFVLSSVRLLSSASRMEMLTTLWPDALDCIVTRGGRSTRARRAPARAARRGRAAGHAASISARGMVFLSWTVSASVKWPMADVVARGGIGRLRVPRGASGTRYVSMRGLIGSRRVPST